MMNRSWVAALAVVVGAALPGPAHAWDKLGHKVVARIAWDHMTPAAREGAVSLLMQAPEDAGIRALLPEDGRPMAERQRDLFVNTSYWADLIRSRSHPGNRYAHSEWHYVNFFWEQQRPGGPVIQRPDKGTAGELVAQEARIVREMVDTSRPAGDRAVDLAWLLHLVGDAHQPLHNSARITPQDPEGDRGGNDFQLAGIYPFNQLHGYWDSLIGFSEPWAVGESAEEEYVATVAGRLARRFPHASLRGSLRLGQYEAWGREGLAIAQRFAFPEWLERGRPAPRRYRSHAYAAVDQHVALAGYRLAETLNAAFGG